MSADLGTKINTRKRAVRIDPDAMEDVGMEWGDKRDWVSFKVGDTGDVVEEIMFDKFFLGNPKLFSVVINNGILVRVVVDNVSAGGSVEEIGEEINYGLL